MKGRLLQVVGIAGIVSINAASITGLVACATDETPEAAAAPEPNPSVNVDAGGEGADTDDIDPCVPGALCPNGPFDPKSPDRLDLRTRISVIRGRSADDVWAAGARGTVLHFDGTSWKRSEVGTTASIDALWLRDSAELAIASRSAVYSRGLPVEDGGADAAPLSAGGWSARSAPAGPPELNAALWRLTSAWMAPDAEWLWCTTEEFMPPLGNDRVNGLWRLRVDPSTQRLQIAHAVAPSTCATLGCKQMMSIHGASADDLWAVGFTGATFHITNAQGDEPTIMAFDSQTWAGLNSVWVASKTDAWAVGGAGVIRHYTGQAVSWDVVSDVPTKEDLRAVWGSSSSDVWAVGDRSVVLHYDGKSWSRVHVGGLGGRRPDLYSVWTSGPGRVWAGGDGLLLSLEGKP